MSDTTDGLQFPQTAWSALVGPAMSAEERRRRMGRLVELYWKPVFSVLRRFHAKENHDARDLTQSFFAHILEHDVVERYDPARGRFRTYLKACLRNYLAQYAERRMPTLTEISIPGLATYDPPAPEPAGDDQADAAFDSVWIRTVFDRAIAEVRRLLLEAGRERAWRAFELYDVATWNGEEPPTYAEVAARLGATEHEVHRDLANTRALLRGLVEQEVRQTVDPREYADERRFVFRG